MMKLRVPTYLQFSTDVGGPERLAWLATLANRVEELTACWGTGPRRAVRTRRELLVGHAGTDRGGRELVLKVAWQHTDARHEAEWPRSAAAGRSRCTHSST